MNCVLMNPNEQVGSMKHTKLMNRFFRSKNVEPSSEEEEMQTPEPAPAKKSKMLQFEPKQKLRLVGAVPKPRPMETKRRKGGEAVIHGKTIH